MKDNVLHIVRMVATTLAVLLAAVGMHGQELTITEATQAMEPMTVPMQRLDFNEQICALVKVVIPVAGVQFEGNIVGEPVFKTSEYWVYLTPGTKMMKIKAPGYYPVMADFRELGLGALESKAIYYLTLKGLNAPVPVASAANQAGQATNNVAGAAGEYSTTPVNLALCAELNGRIVYITLQQWWAMPEAEKAACKKKGLCVIGNDERFLLALNDSGKKMTWIEATSNYGDSLPTKEQAEVMAKNYTAINATITAFGGDKDPTKRYWTRTEDYSFSAWYVFMDNGNIYLNGKTSSVMVRAVAPVPSASAVNQQSQATNNVVSAADEYSTTPVNLALCAELNGKIVYITLKQWFAMSKKKKAACKKKGLCVIGNDERFLLALKDSGKRMTWDEAMSRYGDSLPTMEQAEVMAENHEAINAAIIAFGGDKDPMWMYWTRTEKNSTDVYFIAIGNVGIYGKKYPARVRTVAPVPE